jgi:hypothetical protein
MRQNIPRFRKAAETWTGFGTHGAENGGNYGFLARENVCRELIEIKTRRVEKE